MQVVQSVGRLAFLITSANYFQIFGKQRLFCFDAKIIAHFLQNVCTLYSAITASQSPSIEQLTSWTASIKPYDT